MNNTQKKERTMGIEARITWNRDIVDQVNIIGSVLEDMQHSLQDYLAHYPIAPPIPKIRMNEHEQDDGTPYNVSLILDVILQTLYERKEDITEADWARYCDQYESVRNSVDTADNNRKVYYSDNAVIMEQSLGEYIEAHNLPPCRQGMRFRTPRGGYNRRLLVYIAIVHAVDVIANWNKKSGTK